MSKSPHKLHVINPGFDRYSLNSPNGPEQQIRVFLSPTPQGRLEDSVWPSLQWWESPLQAEAGIKALSVRLFLHLRKPSQESATVLAHQLYDDALDPADDAKVSEAAHFIAVHMRQGRELYMAAGSAGVTDLSTPLLYYYGALALAKAATAAVFGAWNQLGERHGLTHDQIYMPTSDHPSGRGWPTVITWGQKGIFKRFYRAARWDQMWSQWSKLGLPASPQFHVLECLRYPRSDWSPLRPTGFVRPDSSPQGRRDQQHPREKVLLAFRPRGDLFMRLTTPLTAPVFQVPLVIVQFMLLHYFSTLARYHAGAWQELLGGATEPEGHVFRAALQGSAGRFLREISFMLPLPHDSIMYPVPRAPLLPTPLPLGWHDAWYISPEETSDYPTT